MDIESRDPDGKSAPNCPCHLVLNAMYPVAGFRIDRDLTSNRLCIRVGTR
jgi:hypothetical protein